MMTSSTALHVRFGPKHLDNEGRVTRVLPGRLVIETFARFALHSTLNLEIENGSVPIRARAAVERVAPLGPWAGRGAPGPGGPVALTVIVISESPELRTMAEERLAVDERRQGRRYPEALRVSQSGPGALGNLRASNVSRGGAFVETPSAFDPGMPFAFRLHLPGNQPPLRVEGRVVHVVEAARAQALGLRAGVGVAFGDLLANEAHHLEAYLQRQATIED
jgi:Tfp pilus assembly protein PilZ